MVIQGYEMLKGLHGVANMLRTNSATQLAELSGGESFHFTNRKTFEQSLQRISNEIHDYYLLRFQPHDPDFGRHTLTLRVEGDDLKGGRNATLRDEQTDP